MRNATYIKCKLLNLSLLNKPIRIVYRRDVDHWQVSSCLAESDSTRDIQLGFIVRKPIWIILNR